MICIFLTYCALEEPKLVNSRKNEPSFTAVARAVDNVDAVNVQLCVLQVQDIFPLSQSSKTEYNSHVGILLHVVVNVHQFVYRITLLFLSQTLIRLLTLLEEADTQIADIISGLVCRISIFFSFQLIQVGIFR